MALSLKHLLEEQSKPLITTNLDEEENDITRARISKKVNNFDKKQSSSKLRALNASTLADKDPKYKVVKVTRKKQKEPEVDPELEKMLYDMDSTSEDEGSSDEFKENNDSLPSDFDDDDDDAESEINQIERNLKTIRQQVSENQKRQRRSDVDEEENSEGSENEEAFTKALQNVDVLDDENEEEPSKVTNVVRKPQISKQQGQAVQNQLKLFGQCMQMRTVLQKVLPLCNQLPQSDIFSQFLQGDDELESISSKANETAKNLVLKFMDLQDALMKQNSKALEMCEDILKESPKKGTRRKLKNLENSLSKRHKAFTPYRDSILNDCHSKASMLSKSYDSFKQFDVSASTQLQNILSDKEPLIKRTQLRSLSRGNHYKIIGKENQLTGDEYDPEIFDDSDFYSVLLSQATKSKTFSPLENALSRKELLQIQKEKGKRHHKASKGKRMRTEPIKPVIGFFSAQTVITRDETERQKLLSSLFQKTSL